MKIDNDYIELLNLITPMPYGEGLFMTEVAKLYGVSYSSVKRKFTNFKKEFPELYKNFKKLKRNQAKLTEKHRHKFRKPKSYDYLKEFYGDEVDLIIKERF